MKTRQTANEQDSIAMTGLVRIANVDHLQYGTAADESDEKPTVNDLASQLRFSPRTGRIWLGEQRMLLLHGRTFAALRHELIERLGIAGARALLMRIGYASGARDAEVVRRAWPAGDELGAFTAGTRLHALEGAVKVTTLNVSSDIGRGHFRGEYLWHDSLEAAEFVAAYGLAREPTCWMQIGYASGYASAFIGKLVVFREVECMAMGASACRIIGQPADAWNEPLDEVQFLSGEPPPRSHQTTKPAANRKPATTSSAAGGDSRTPRIAPEMVGVSAAFTAARYRVERVARTHATVLIIGESGVGKELFAKALHQLSPRRDKPFIAVNCAAIPDTLIESELFGVEKGAYTGAATSRPGRFERSSGGTLFLDEVPSLSLIAQGKLLRAIQEREIDRVGATHPTKVDVRIIAATNQDLRAEVRAGRFRDDLYFRLNVFPIRLPPLRERRDDIPLLLEHFLSLYNQLYGKNVTAFHRRAVEALLNHDYPGNIRELQNIVERGVINAPDDGTIDLQDIFQPGDNPQGSGLFVAHNAPRTEPSAATTAGLPSEGGPEKPRELVDELLSGRAFSLIAHEKDIYQQALARCAGNIAAAARLLGLTRAQLAYRLKSLATDAQCN